MLAQTHIHAHDCHHPSVYEMGAVLAMSNGFEPTDFSADCKLERPAAAQPSGKERDVSSTQDTRVVSATASFCRMSKSNAAALCKGLDLGSSPLAAALAKELALPFRT